MDEIAENKRRRHRRRKRRLSAAVAFLFFATLFVWFLESQDTTTLIVTRHAEVATLGGRDPGLTAAGQRRANVLARTMRFINVDFGVDGIFVAPTRRARDTAVPLAMRSDAPVQTIDDPADTDALIQQIMTEYKGDVVLVVTDAEYIKPLVRAMKGSRKVQPIDPDEFDNIYIVTRPWFGKVETIRLKYGAPYRPKTETEDQPDS